MKLQFRHQAFQADAAKAVCDVFAGQPFRTPTYMMDSGLGQLPLYQTIDFTGFSNSPVVVSNDKILEHIRAIQLSGGIKPSETLDGRFNLTIEMETGVEKPTPILKRCTNSINVRVSKFIIVVPSVAIR